MDDETIMGSLVATIGDREVVTKVEEKQKAAEKYEDAMATGKAAVFVEKIE